jgi:hypothetical protein
MSAFPQSIKVEHGEKTYVVSFNPNGKPVRVDLLKLYPARGRAIPAMTRRRKIWAQTTRRFASDIEPTPLASTLIGKARAQHVVEAD